MEGGVAIERGFDRAAFMSGGVDRTLQGDFGGAATEKGVVDGDVLSGVAAGGFDGVPMDGLEL